jgi:hypothetical protein
MVAESRASRASTYLWMSDFTAASSAATGACADNPVAEIAVSIMMMVHMRVSVSTCCA